MLANNPHVIRARKIEATMEKRASRTSLRASASALAGSACLAVSAEIVARSPEKILFAGAAAYTGASLFSHAGDLLRWITTDRRQAGDEQAWEKEKACAIEEGLDIFELQALQMQFEKDAILDGLEEALKP